MFKLGGSNVDNALFIITILNSILIYFVYLLARQFLQPAYAILATFLFATSPWPVYYAVGLWNPIPLAILGVFLFLALWRVTQTDNSRSIFWVCLLVAVIPHFHMIGVFYIPAILLILFLSPKKLNKSYFLAGFIAACLIYLPYIIGEINHDWQNTQQVLTGSKGWSFSAIKIITAPITVLSNHPGRWAGDELQEFIKFGNTWFGSFYILLILNLISILTAAIFLLWLIKSFFKLVNFHSFKQSFNRQPAIMFVVILLALPLLLFMITGHNYSTRYTIIILPLLFLIPAWYLQQARQTKFKRFILKTLPIVVVTNFYLILVYYVHQYNEINNGQYLVSTFRKMETIRQDIRKNAGPQAYIRVDPTGYIRNTTDKIENAGTALAQYIDAYENYFQPHVKSGDKITYTIVSADNEVKDRSMIAYSDNNTYIIREQK
jgi:hypothetical protein